MDYAAAGTGMLSAVRQTLMSQLHYLVDIILTVCLILFFPLFFPYFSHGISCVLTTSVLLNKDDDDDDVLDS